MWANERHPPIWRAEIAQKQKRHVPARARASFIFVIRICCGALCAVEFEQLFVCHTGNYTGNCGFAYAGWTIENHILYCAVFYGTAEYSILAEKMLLTTYVIQFFRSQGCC